MSNPDLQINHFFSTPVMILTDNNYEANVDQLLQEIYEWRDSDTVDLVRSNHGGWHSPTDIFKTQKPGLRRVCKLMVECFTRSTKQVAPEFSSEAYDMKGEGWVNINPQHGFNVPHDHPGYTWSGVYYVKLPEKLNKDSRSGSIELLDPRTNVSAMASDIARKSLYFSPKRTLNPVNGMILIFPSYLRHWVYPNEEPEDRISMAFNFKFWPKVLSEPPKEPPAVLSAKSNKGPKKKKKKG